MTSKRILTLLRESKQEPTRSCTCYLCWPIKPEPNKVKRRFNKSETKKQLKEYYRESCG